MKAAVLEMDQGQFGERIVAALRRHFGAERHGAKRLAQYANCNERAAKNWIQGKNTPDALHLLRLFATVPEVAAEVRRLTAAESDFDPEFERDLHQLLNTYQRLKSARAEG